MDCRRIVSPKLYRFFVFFSVLVLIFLFLVACGRFKLAICQPLGWAHVNYIVYGVVLYSRPVNFITALRPSVQSDNDDLL